MFISKIKRITTFLTAISVIFLSLTACNQKSNNSSIAEVSSDTADDAVKSTIYDSVSEEHILEYENKLFDTSYVHTIDISISDDDWADLTENPLKKTKYEVNITIDGETWNNVSFATKGNTSLSSVADDKDSNRYSFKVNFGKYVNGQTYYGLNKLNLNNLYADATYMKDYLSNEEYLEKYHEVFDELLTNYFKSGEFEKQTDNLYEMILPYVEKDSSAFYNTEEFNTAYITLKKFCKYRAESIRAQLNGTLSAETDKQDLDTQIIVSDITINDMGKQDNGPKNDDMKTPPEFDKNNNK